MSLKKVEQFLYHSMGLDGNTIGPSAITQAVKQRMASCQLHEIAHYHDRLLTDEEEVQALIDQVIVPETWFFRGARPFEMLSRFALEEWLPSGPTEPLRILSIPCSTGEEPYSIVMTLIDAGLTPSQVHIDAFDISQRNIQRCKEAGYTNNSFRNVDPARRDWFFRRQQGRYYPDILIRAMVNFGQTNLLDPTFTQTRSTYDVVFCRNLLIYFDQHTKINATRVLDKLLSPKGLLFVGHAETGNFFRDWYVSHRYPKAFAMRKFEDNPKQHHGTLPKTKRRSARRKSGKLCHVKPLNAVPAKSIKPVPAKPSKKPHNIPTSSHQQKLELAQQFADAGQFTESEDICLQLLEQNKQDTKAYFLLALIQLGVGDPHKAAHYFYHVTYLEPENFDALMYMATLTEQQGNQQQAQGFRERAQRIKQRTNNHQASL